mgnify:CR=1 FL=1
MICCENKAEKRDMKKFKKVCHKALKELGKKNFALIVHGNSFPAMIREEKNIVKKEDLYFKYLHVKRDYASGHRHTNESFDVLNEMNDLFYKKEVKLPKGESLKYKEEIQSQLFKASTILDTSIPFR